MKYENEEDRKAAQYESYLRSKEEKKRRRKEKEQTVDEWFAESQRKIQGDKPLTKNKT